VLEDITMDFLILFSYHYQILVGRIASSNKDGILVSLDFFDDVFIPSYLLQAPSEFNSATSLWLWKYGEEESGDEFVMDIGEQVFLNS
jgi:DNA-directed RNA polymerase III subunit RPC8